MVEDESTGSPAAYDPIDPVTRQYPDHPLMEVTTPISYYLHDHLGNTRMIIRADDPSAMTITYAADYYPYGKILRDWSPCEPERFLTTQHERDSESGYDNRGARLYDADVGRFLSVDPMAQEFGAVSPYNYVLGNPVRLVDPDGKAPNIPTPKEAALIANHVYGGVSDNTLIGGWRVSDQSISGVTFNDSNSGLQSALYERVNDAGEVVEYVYATAGTNDAADYDDNAVQAAQTQLNRLGIDKGPAEQYSQSVSNSKILNQKIDAELTFVGHSLGGGLASANTLATGRNGVTSNAAGLSQGTKDMLGLNKQADITAYVVQGEILDFLQGKVNLKAEGNITTLSHQFQGQVPGTPPPKTTMEQRVDAHSMETVLEKF